MKTKCFILENNEPIEKALAEIVKCVPCFVTINAFDEKLGLSSEVSICAREEDWAWIERTLAPFV